MGEPPTKPGIASTERALLSNLRELVLGLIAHTRPERAPAKHGRVSVGPESPYQNRKGQKWPEVGLRARFCHYRDPAFRMGASLACMPSPCAHLWSAAHLHSETSETPPRFFEARINSQKRATLLKPFSELCLGFLGNPFSTKNLKGCFTFI